MYFQSKMDKKHYLNLKYFPITLEIRVCSRPAISGIGTEPANYASEEHPITCLISPQQTMPYNSYLQSITPTH